eukprot:6194122-Pleurochrysis_carterae.AAC.1
MHRFAWAQRKTLWARALVVRGCENVSFRSARAAASALTLAPEKVVHAVSLLATCRGHRLTKYVSWVHCTRADGQRVSAGAGEQARRVRGLSA